MMDIQKLKEVIHYDPETGNFTWLKPQRGAVTVGAIAGGVNQEGYVEIRVCGTRYKAHRLAWFYMTGKWPRVIDHRNRIRSDNRFCNLRECSVQENSCNKERSERNSSGFTGVSKHKQSGKWRVDVKCMGNKKFFGLYDDVELAALVAQAAREKYHGEFAADE